MPQKSKSSIEGEGEAHPLVRVHRAMSCVVQEYFNKPDISAKELIAGVVLSLLECIKNMNNPQVAFEFASELLKEGLKDLEITAETEAH